MAEIAGLRESFAAGLAELAAETQTSGSSSAVGP